MSSTTAKNERRAPVLAVLGPTNTGKTHLAMERMLSSKTGMIGFPLRLLARENYDRAVKAKGADTVALITGEEKIVPSNARYFLCTVESMPVDRRVAFVGVDEIQLCADPDRGHIFTERLLFARGTEETMLMGADTIRPLIRRLVPEARFVSRPRFSSLRYGGMCKVSKLPPRTAVVAFSTSDVYALAELLRRQRGGAAVVLGALSPRTRNAQVALYQAGEVDHLVATDAIGMGLNLAVDHVAFAATRKFDGKVRRPLNAPEMAQIAGRAGRHVRDGTFGTTSDARPFDPELADRIENHRFDPVSHIFWRNPDLDFATLKRLQRSLSRVPDQPGMVRVRESDDEVALASLSREADIEAAAGQGWEAVELLWQVCQIPDFGNVTNYGHSRLLGQIYRSLMAHGGPIEGRLPTDWLARQVDRVNRVDGDIDTLMQRIANIRTWTYVSHQPWLDRSLHWQERTRTIEDRLSDALHDRLLHRFVDRRTAVLVGRLRNQADILGTVSDAGDVLVDGHNVGRLDGFQFRVDAGLAAPRGSGEFRNAKRTVTAAAQMAVTAEVMRRLRNIETDGDHAFSLETDGQIVWRGTPIAHLSAGADILRPNAQVPSSDFLDANQRDRLRSRISIWLSKHIRQALAPLFLETSRPLSGAAQGLLFQVAEGLGVVDRRRAADQVAALQAPDRKELYRVQLTIGRESVYFASLLKPRSLTLRRLLWGVTHGGLYPPLPSPGRVALAICPDVPTSYYEAIGYRVLGGQAIRVDIVERLSSRLATLAREGAFVADDAILQLAGCRRIDIAGVLADLGYVPRQHDGAPTRYILRKRALRRRPARRLKGNDAPQHAQFAPLIARRLPI